ncbi:MAG: GNAT family N-acetyltransferase [Polyangiaceae bacterium]
MKRAGVVTVRQRVPADDERILSLAKPSFGKYSLAPEQGVWGMLNHRGSVTVVAEAEGRVVGFAIVSFEALSKPFGPWARPVLAHLDAIAVQERAQGMGVGSALITEVERISRSREAVSINLRTATTNTRAQALFRRAGFQKSLRIESFYRGGLGAFAMTKLLAT